MNLTQTKIHVPIWVIFLTIIVIFVVLFSFWFFKGSDPKYIGLISGLLSGTIVYAIQFLMQIFPLMKLDKYERMGIKDLLDNRHDKQYYKPIVRSAKKTIKVMGASCSRFVSDFMDPESDDSAVIDALRSHRRLEVKLLIPDDEHMEGQNRARWRAEAPKLAAVFQEFEGRVEVRRFSEDARQSMVLADEHLIVGPIFPGDDSRNTPAVHVSADKTFSEKCIRYFDRVWGEANVEDNR